MTWLELWRYAREDRARMARLLVIILTALVALGVLIASIVVVAL